MTDVVEIMARGIARGALEAAGYDNHPALESMIDTDWRHCNPEAQTALSALDAAGYAVVRKEPTEAMTDASRQALGNYIRSLPPGKLNAVKEYQGGFRLHDETLKASIRYRAMIAASK